MTGSWAASASDILGRVRGAVLLAFWLCLLFFPEHPAADALLASLALAGAALSVVLLARAEALAPAQARTEAQARRQAHEQSQQPRRPQPPPQALGLAGALWQGLLLRMRMRRGLWPYAAYLLLLTIAWRLHATDASTQEYLRQLCFLATVLAVAEGARGATRRWVAIVVIGLALVIVQILGPHSVVDALGRPLHYRSIQQWSGYPEIGLLATIGAVASLALALAERRWRVRLAAALLAGGFAAATMYLLSRFSLITIVITGVWLAIVAAIGLRSRLGMMLLAACVIGGAGLVLVRADFSARLHAVFVDRTAAVDIRSEGWRVARAMVRDHPLLGVGPGRYREEYPRYSSMGDSSHAYNLVLHEAAELGVLGVAAYLLLWVRVLWRTLRATTAAAAAGSRAIAAHVASAAVALAHAATAAGGATAAAPAAAADAVAAAAASAAGSAGRRSAIGAAALAVHGMLVAFFLRSQSEHFLANLGASFRVLLLLAFLFGLAESLRLAPRAPREHGGGERDRH